MKFALTLALLVACLLPAAARAAAPEKVTIQLDWLPEPEFGGIYEAQRAGLFAKHGLDVQILKGGPDVPAVQMTAASQVSFGVAAADEVISLREKGGDVVGIYATYQTSPQGIMAHTSQNLKDIPDLLKNSGMLAVQPGLAYVTYFKQKYDTKTKLVPYQGGIAQFLSDKDLAQQCFVTSEPIAAKKAGADTKVFLIADTGFNPYTGVIITRGDFLKKNHATTVRFVTALREGWRAYLDNPAPANELMAKLNTSMDLATFAAAAEAQKPLIENADTKEHGLGSMTKARWETLSQQLVKLNVVKKAAAADACFQNIK